MKKKIFIAIVASIGIAMFFACSQKDIKVKEEVEVEVEVEEVTVYVAGYEGNIAKLWINGKYQNLIDTTNSSYAYSVFAADSNVYIAGLDCPKNNFEAGLWKNGKKQDLLDVKHSVAKSVFVSGNDVYIAGIELDKYPAYAFIAEADIFISFDEGKTKPIAKLWKNGAAQNLTNGKHKADVSSVFVANNDVYVVGCEENAKKTIIAKLWKNGVSQSLTDGKYSANARSVFVFGDDVYISGYESDGNKDDKGNNKDIAKLWKNGIAQNLTDGTNNASAASVFVSNNDVYVVGYESSIDHKRIAKLWKNGKAQNLTDGTNDAYANSVFVLNNDVYVVGYEKDGDKDKDDRSNSVAKLWKNGVEQKLTDGTKSATAKSVFVKKSTKK